MFGKSHHLNGPNFLLFVSMPFDKLLKINDGIEQSNFLVLFMELRLEKGNNLMSAVKYFS